MIYYRYRGGVISLQCFETRVRVRFGETDMLGHVNNAVYMTYLEEARIEFLYQALSLNSMPFIMASARMDYIRQAFFPGSLRITTGVSKIGRTSFDITHQIFGGEPEHVVMNAQVTLVHFDYASQQATPLPQHFRDIFLQYSTEPLFTAYR